MYNDIHPSYYNEITNDLWDLISDSIGLITEEEFIREVRLCFRQLEEL